LPVSLKGKRRAGLRQGVVKHRFCAAEENRDRRKLAERACYPAGIAAFGKICRDALGKKRHIAMRHHREMPAIPRKKWLTAARLSPNKDKRHLYGYSNQARRRHGLTRLKRKAAMQCIARAQARAEAAKKDKGRCKSIAQRAGVSRSANKK
jgi:hypothetical protein